MNERVVGTKSTKGFPLVQRDKDKPGDPWEVVALFHYKHHAEVCADILTGEVKEKQFAVLTPVEMFPMGEE